MKPRVRTIVDRSKPSKEPVRVPLRTERKCARAFVGTADADILVLAAVTIAGRPRQTPAPVGNARQSPSANDVIRQSVGAAHVFLALAERQFIEDVRYPHVIPVHIHGAIAD